MLSKYSAQCFIHFTEYHSVTSLKWKIVNETLFLTTAYDSTLLEDSIPEATLKQFTPKKLLKFEREGAPSMHVRA